MRLTIYAHEFEFPPRLEPDWAHQVERWYQLDAAAFGLADAYWKYRENLVSFPEWLLLCSPAGSNATDAQFAASPPSPAKFVHTLPNIRSAALLQLMGWAGPVLCIQNDPNTILTGLSEGLSLAQRVWVVSASLNKAHIFVLGPEGPLKIEKTQIPHLANGPGHDKHWLSWISKPQNRPYEGPGLRIG